MANAVWPASLPAPLSGAGITYGKPNNVIESPMEMGNTKRRRRFTAPEIPVSGATLLLTAAQLATLETFYYTTLAQVLPFDMTDYRTGATATYCFTKDGYEATSMPNSNGMWQAVLNLVRKP